MAHTAVNFGTGYLSHSADSATTFSKVDVGPVRGDVALAGGGQGRFVHGGDVIGMRTSPDYGATWSAPSSVAGAPGEAYKAGPNVVLGATSTLVSWSPLWLEGRGIHARRGR